MLTTDNTICSILTTQYAQCNSELSLILKTFLKIWNKLIMPVGNEVESCHVMILS